MITDFILLFFFLWGFPPFAGGTVHYEGWERIGNLEQLSILSIQTTSINDVFAATVDKKDGPFIYYSYNAGATWEKVQTMGNNNAMAVSGNGKSLCAAGTKAYCAKATQNLGWDVFELNFPSQVRDVKAIGDEGFGMVGSFTAADGDVINGIAYLESFEHHWLLRDIQLDRKEGYFAMQGSFSSANTWFVTSGSWPIHSPLTANTLSGRLSMIATGDSFFNYKYTFDALPWSPSPHYVGAISKTTDAGRSWKKVFDSNKQFYFNQMDCIDGGEMCIVVGEGPEKSLVLRTVDGGDSWQTILTLNPSYSLHACEMISGTEYWIGGGILVHEDIGSHNITGVYFKTETGGNEWKMLESKEGYVYDFHFFNDHIGYAATINEGHCSLSKLMIK